MSMDLFDVFVRAETSDGRFATVNVTDLDEPSFRRFIADALARMGIIVGLAGNTETLKTPLTRAEAEKKL